MNNEKPISSVNKLFLPLYPYLIGVRPATSIKNAIHVLHERPLFLAWKIEDVT